MLRVILKCLSSRKVEPGMQNRMSPSQVVGVLCLLFSRTSNVNNFINCQICMILFSFIYQLCIHIYILYIKFCIYNKFFQIIFVHNSILIDIKIIWIKLVFYKFISTYTLAFYKIMWNKKLISE